MTKTQVAFGNGWVHGNTHAVAVSNREAEEIHPNYTPEMIAAFVQGAEDGRRDDQSRLANVA